MLNLVVAVVLVSDAASEGRSSCVKSLLNRLSHALIECPDDKLAERVAVVSKILQVWSEGEEVDLRCIEPPEMITAQLSAADVERLTANGQNAPGLLSVCDSYHFDIFDSGSNIQTSSF